MNILLLRININYGGVNIVLQLFVIIKMEEIAGTYSQNTSSWKQGLEDNKKSRSRKLKF